MNEHANCVIITMDLSVSFTYVAVEEVFKLNCMESRWIKGRAGHLCYYPHQEDGISI